MKSGRWFRLAGWLLVFMAAVSGTALAADRMRRSEVTSMIYQQLPFLKPGIRFWDECPGNNPGHGEQHELVAELLPDGKRIVITTANDMRSLFSVIGTPDEALMFVRFFDDRNMTGSCQSFAYFQDVAFAELRPAMGPVTMTKEMLSSHGVTDPHAEQAWIPDNPTPGFRITRYVMLRDQFDRLLHSGADGRKEKTDGLQTIDEIGRVTETVYPSSYWDYLFTLERLPVKDFQVTFQPEGCD